jgi:integrase
MERQQEPVSRIRETLPDNDPNFDRKLDLATAGAHPYIKDHLLTRVSRANCQTIIDYVLAFQTEVNPSQQYRIDTIYKLKQLAEYHNPKSFKDMTRQDVIDFLDHYRKPESVDPLHKWIGTYELTRIILLRFFKWLYYWDHAPHNTRPKPDVMANIPRIKRREISIYKPTDLWTEEDDVLFYKYCPSLRDRCWHAVARDTGCRPHEMLKLKVKDVVAQQLEGGYQVAKITVNGKTGTRQVRLNNSYPVLKEWLTYGHPYGGNPLAPLFCGTGRKNTGKRLAPHTIHTTYVNYKKVHFPRLLRDPMVPEEDKRKITELLKKPWNPYIRRHTAATEISKSLKDSVLIDQYMGWSHAGNTRQKYQHYYNDDSFDAMLTMMDGLAPPSTAKAIGKYKHLLKPRHCPNCDEMNKLENRFCAKCKYVLTYDAFNETVQDAERTKKELEQIKSRQNAFEGALKKMIATEMDLDVRDPKEQKRLDEVFNRAIAPTDENDYFGPE